MKKFIIVLVVTFVTIASYAQDRVNGTSYKFSYESNKITNIEGWKYLQKEEKWVGNQNCISAKDEGDYGKLITSNIRKNLQSVQTFKFSYQSTEYYVVDLVFNGGYYRYPSIKEDWVKLSEHYTYLVTETDYSNFLHPSETLRCVKTPCYKWSESATPDQNVIIRKLIEYKEKEAENSRISIYSGEYSIKRYKDVIRLNYKGEYDTFDWDGSELMKLKPTKEMEAEYFEVQLDNWVF